MYVYCIFGWSDFNHCDILYAYGFDPHEVIEYIATIKMLLDDDEEVYVEAIECRPSDDIRTCIVDYLDRGLGRYSIPKSVVPVAGVDFDLLKLKSVLLPDKTTTIVLTEREVDEIESEIEECEEYLDTLRRTIIQFLFMIRFMNSDTSAYLRTAIQPFMRVVTRATMPPRENGNPYLKLREYVHPVGVYAYNYDLI